MSIKASLLAALEKHAGKIVYLADLARETKLTPNQVQSNLSNLRNDPTDTGFDMKQSLKVVTRGQAWLWQPVAADNATPSGGVTVAPRDRHFEEMGATASGDIIVRCEDGTIWKVVPL